MFRTRHEPIPGATGSGTTNIHLHLRGVSSGDRQEKGQSASFDVKLWLSVVVKHSDPAYVQAKRDARVVVGADLVCDGPSAPGMALTSSRDGTYRVSDAYEIRPHHGHNVLSQVPVPQPP